MKNERVFRAAVMVFASILASGCAHRLSKKSAPLSAAGPVDKTVAALSTEPVSAVVEDSSVEPDVRDDIMRSRPELKTVYFDYDSDILSSEARDELASNAEWLKSHESVRVQVTGNCDQRGTVEYNLALGQRRASSVREYYMHLGVPGKRIATISYGKEHLVCRQSAEICWQKNRRAETLEAVARNIGMK